MFVILVKLHKTFSPEKPYLLSVISYIKHRVGLFTSCCSGNARARRFDLRKEKLTLAFYWFYTEE